MWSSRLSWALLPLALACSPRDRETAAVASDTASKMTADTAHAAAPAAVRTGNSKIDDAMSAAPAAIAQKATIMDWPDSAAGQPKELRRGSNEWTCFPSTPKAVGSSGRDPMCLDKEFMSWANALVAKKPPHVKNVGIGYMLHGDMGASNIDPYATDSTADNQWVRAGPHLMVITPNTAQLAATSADPKNGGPWVMWKGTPYAHIMVPAQ